VFDVYEFNKTVFYTLTGGCFYANDLASYLTISALFNW